MPPHFWAGMFVLLSWWLSTGAILLMDGLPRATFRYSVAGASVVAVAALGGLWWSSQAETSVAAYVAFSSALAVWGWHELVFLLGLISGPRKEACPPDARGWKRFVYATQAILHHELALAATLLAVVALTWGAPNQVGCGTFMVLWVMRLSAKFNVFLGVRNLNVQFIPEHLVYLASYFRKARFNMLMPVSLLVSGAAVVHLAGGAAAAGAAEFVQVGQTLVATILGMAVVEHVFLMLPIPDALLWRWALREGHGRVGAAVGTVGRQSSSTQRAA